MTLEATIVFPVFLAVLILLINLVNISLSYIAMDHAVSETVKQVAVQAYPLKYLKAGSGANSTKDKFDDYINIIGKKISGETANIAVNALTKYVILAKIKELYPLSDVAAKDIRITEFNMYNPNNIPEDPGDNDKFWCNKDIAVTVEYKIKLLVPFVPLQEIVLSNSAVERAWVDD